MTRDSLIGVGRTLAFFLIGSNCGELWADGGAVRLHQQVSGYQIAAFTSPTPFRQGPVDVSVLVQDVNTGVCISDAEVTVTLKKRASAKSLEVPATAEAATNKLFYAAVFQLPDAGLWDVEITVQGGHGSASVHFEVNAAEPLPRWLELWPWFGWPFLVVALFGIHQVLLRRTAGNRSTRTSRRQGESSLIFL